MRKEGMQHAPPEQRDQSEVQSTYVPKTPEGEMIAEAKLDVAVVLGEGPVLPVLLPDEVTEEQRSIWESFVTDPQHQKQPDFYVLTGNAYVSELEEIEKNESLSPEEKERLIRETRDSWQNTGRFALKRMGRLNALAAGDALLKGKVDRLILSGGRTIPKWKREMMTKEYLELHPEQADLEPEKLDAAVNKYITTVIKWPSEAKLMQDVIIKTYGWNFFSQEYSQEKLHALYTERFGEVVDDRNREDYKAFEGRVYSQYIKEKLEPRLLLEEESMNTLDNIIYSTNKYPELMTGNDKKIGIFASDWHRSRALVLAERFLIHVDEDAGISSQQYLRERALKRKKIPYVKLMDTLMDRENEPVKASRQDSARLLLGLMNEAHANYWAGWIFKVQDPQMFVEVLKQFNNPRWVQSMSEEFHKVGLNFEALAESDLITLAEEDPLTYQQIIDKGLRLTTPELRKILPPVDKMRLKKVIIS